MKLKALLFSLFLLALYAMVTEYWKKSTRIISHQGQWSQNVINAQRFLYDFSPKHFNCIVGSSLTSILSMETSPSNYYNLSFSGLSAQDGIALLACKPSLPDTLFVETNVLSRGASKEFKETLMPNPFIAEMKGKLVVFQERNHPLGILSNAIEYLLSHQLYILRHYYRYGWVLVRNKLFPTRSMTTQKEETLENMLQLNRMANNDSSKMETARKNIQLSISALKALESKSVKVVLFEMPVHCEVQNSSVMALSRAMLHRSFPPTRYSYLRTPDCSTFETTDGVHLNAESIKAYSSYFFKEIKEIE
jgi:hypothetical protein